MICIRNIFSSKWTIYPILKFKNCNVINSNWYLIVSRLFITPNFPTIGIKKINIRDVVHLSFLIFFLIYYKLHHEISPHLSPFTNVNVSKTKVLYAFTYTGMNPVLFRNLDEGGNLETRGLLIGKLCKIIAGARDSTTFDTQYRY